MNWNGPFTAKQFVILFWGPVLLTGIIVGSFYWRAAQRAEAADEARQEQLMKNMREVHGNIDAVNQQHNMMGH